MILLIVRDSTVLFRKELVGIYPLLEGKIRSVFRILDNPRVCTISDVSLAIKLKNVTARLNVDAAKYKPLRAVLQYVNRLDDQEHVVLLDGDKYKTQDIIAWRKALEGMKQGMNPVEAYVFWNFKVPHQFYPRYDTYLFTDLGFDQYIGEWDKTKRRCRFCGETGEGVFGDRKNSHAISSFLGNESIFCLEECKTCNHDFGIGIEKDLENYYHYFRVAGNRKSRSGKTMQAEGVNYELQKGRLRYYVDELFTDAPCVGEKIPEDGIPLKLENKEPVVLHNVYKTLVKYVISCLPNNLLPAFEATVKWVKGGKHPRKGQLPPVYRIETLNHALKPSLCIYIRKDKRKDMPYCIGELRFMEVLYVFAVPYCKGNDMMNAYLHKPLATFVAQRYPSQVFTIENFCDNGKRMVINHVIVEGDAVAKPCSPS